MTLRMVPKSLSKDKHFIECFQCFLLQEEIKPNIRMKEHVIKTNEFRLSPWSITTAFQCGSAPYLNLSFPLLTSFVSSVNSPTPDAFYLSFDSFRTFLSSFFRNFLCVVIAPPPPFPFHSILACITLYVQPIYQRATL